MSEALISIVLPTYNGAKYLALSVESCLLQTHTNFELIIVDDCSTDNTAEIAKAFAAKDQRVIYTRNEKNKKLPLSLNAGFEKARGDYFTWTSDDNYYAPGALALMIKILEDNKTNRLVYTNYTTIDDNGKISGTKIFGDVNQSMVTWQGAGACFLYHADIHKELKGYDASAFLIEDYDFFIRALTKTKFSYLDRSDLYFYRLHEGSLTSLYGFYNFDLQKIVIERQLKNLLPIASKKDQALWFRKFAIYYGVSKNNTGRMNFYLEQLFAVSKGQSFVTVAYILFRKTVTGIRISFLAIGKLLSLLVGIRKNPKA